MFTSWTIAGAFVAAASALAAADVPSARPLWSISSDACIGVHADGDPSLECDFQAFAMNAGGTRVLTVSVTGVIQVWDAEGRELRRVDWPDHRSGASGHPSGRAVISGDTGVAIVHQNQVAILDLADARLRVQHVAEDMMLFDEPRFVGDRLFTSGKDRD
jgi:hypothetical protein